MNLAERLIAASQIKTGTAWIDKGTDAEIEVTVRGVTTDEFLTYGQKRGESPTEGLQYLIERCVVDDAGEPVLTSEQAEKIVKASPRVSQPIVDKILELSGYGAKNG